jgi:hypothetical protein
VDLRSQWESESEDFTPWLAIAENLTLLGDTIGIDLVVEKIEQEVGPYYADILCKQSGTDRWVVIENQLEPTDHSHLGQLLTYSAGLGATTVVWVASRFTNEHRAALDWLNEHTDEDLSFFGIEVELWKIGTSAVAPKFNVVVQPNDWSKSVQASAQSGNLTEAKKTQLAFWTAYRDHLLARSHLRCQKPAPQHWVNTSIGKSGVVLNSIASMWDSVQESYTGEIRIDLLLNDGNSKSYFAQLSADMETIEKEIGEELNWHNPPETRNCRVFIRRAADITDTAMWPEQHEWLRTRLEAFERVFGPRVRKLKSDE